MNLTSLTTKDWHARAAGVRYETRHFIDGQYVDSVARGRFTVVNPATGAPLCEVSAGSCRRHRRGRRGRQAQLLTRGSGAARRRASAWRSWRPIAGFWKQNVEKFSIARYTVHGQADHRHGDHRCAVGGAQFRVFRRVDRQDRRRGDVHRRRCVSLHFARAARRGRLHRAVELSSADGRLEGRAGPRRRQFGGVEAGGTVAAVRIADGATVRGSGRPARRIQCRERPGRGGGRRAGAAQ